MLPTHSRNLLPTLSLRVAPGCQGSVGQGKGRKEEWGVAPPSCQHYNIPTQLTGNLSHIPERKALRSQQK